MTMTISTSERGLLFYIGDNGVHKSRLNPTVLTMANNLIEKDLVELDNGEYRLTKYGREIVGWGKQCQ